MRLSRLLSESQDLDLDQMVTDVLFFSADSVEQWFREAYWEGGHFQHLDQSQMEYIADTDDVLGDEYRAELERYIHHKLQDTETMLASMPDPMPIFREITVAPSRDQGALAGIDAMPSPEMVLSTIRKESVGQYWAWDLPSAQAHWGKFDKGNMPVTLRAEVPHSQIDWRLTVMVNSDPSLGEDEKEIRVRPGTALVISHVALERARNVRDEDWHKWGVIARA